MISNNFYYEGDYAVLESKEDFFKIKKQFDLLKNYEDKLRFWRELDFLRDSWSFQGEIYGLYITFKENYKADADRSLILSIFPTSAEQRFLYGNWVFNLPKYYLEQQIKYYKAKSISESQIRELNLEQFKRDYLKAPLFRKAYLAFYNDDPSELLTAYFFENNNNWDNTGLYKLQKVKHWLEFNKYLGQRDLHKTFENEPYNALSQIGYSDLNDFFTQERNHAFERHLTLYNQNKETEKVNLKDFILSKYKELYNFKNVNKWEPVREKVISIYQQHRKEKSIDEIKLIIHAKLKENKQAYFSEADKITRLTYLASDNFLFFTLANDIAHLDFQEYVGKDYKALQQIPLTGEQDEFKVENSSTSRENDNVAQSLDDLYLQHLNESFNTLKEDYLQEEILATDKEKFRTEKVQELKILRSRFESDPYLNDAIEVYLGFKVNRYEVKDIIKEMETFLFAKLSEFSEQELKYRPEYLKSIKCLMTLLGEYDALIKYTSFIEARNQTPEPILKKKNDNKQEYFPDIFLKDLLKEQAIPKIEFILLALEQHGYISIYAPGKCKWIDNRKGTKLVLKGLSECFQAKGFYDPKKLRDTNFSLSAFSNQFEVDISLSTWSHKGKGKEEFLKILNHI